MYTAFNQTTNTELELVLWNRPEMPAAEELASLMGIWNNDTIQLLEVEYDYREDVYPISGKVRVRIPNSRRARIVETRKAKVRNTKDRHGFPRRVTEWR